MQIVGISLNTFRETIRDKVLYNLVFFVIGLLFLSVIVSEWSIGQESKILKDFGLTIITLFGLLIAIFIGIGLVYKEIDKRTIYAILSKPVPRFKFIIGKYFGLVMTLFLNFLVMTTGFFIVLWIFDGRVDFNLLPAILLIFWEMLIVIAFSILFSSFTNPTLSAIFSIFIFISGHFVADFKLVGNEVESKFFETFLKILYYILPNFEKFNIKGEVVHHLSINPSMIFYALFYGLFYVGVVLLISIISFQKRDF